MPENTQHIVTNISTSAGAAHRPEQVFLQGPHTRTHELRQIVRVAWEMLRGFRVLHFVGPCVTVFGSARFDEAPSQAPASAFIRKEKANGAGANDQNISIDCGVWHEIIPQKTSPTVAITGITLASLELPR